MPTSSAFDLPDRLAAKGSPALIAADEQHFGAIARSLEQSVAELSVRLDAQRKAPGGTGQEALDRDLEIHRLTARLRLLRRFGLDLCLGRIVGADGTEPVYIGRLSLTDHDGSRLLIDWRSPAAEPFFGATHADPMGLTSRRRYRWSRGLVSDYWDEVFTPDGLADNAALDDQSAFIASLGSDRSSRMRDVLGTIQSDQDAIIRAGSRGALVVDGGPGTGKTVVALHRAAYLLYSDSRIARGGGGVLFVGPSAAYLAYVDDVLPSLGEESVQICTLRDLVAEGATAGVEDDPSVAELKSSLAVVKAVDAAVDLYEVPPSTGTTVETPWADLWVSAVEWAEAFDAAEPSVAHNEARDQVWEALLDILMDQRRAAQDEDAEPGEHWGADDERDDDQFDAYGLGTEDSDAALRRALAATPDLVRAFGRAWPLLEATDVVSGLWSVAAFLKRSAPGLNTEELGRLFRADGRAWTMSDLPILDAARLRLGDPEASRRRRRREAIVAAERERMSAVVDDLIAADDSEMGVMKMLRGQDLRATLVDDAALPAVSPDRLSGPFAHIIVDEAQELTDAEWQMLVRRCPSRSFTIVGDRAQARHGFTESWQERLHRIGLDNIHVASLTVNYRTPVEIMTAAEPVIRAAIPGANVPTSIRTGGVPVEYASARELGRVLHNWLAEHEQGEGIACVIATGPIDLGEIDASARVRTLTPQLAKGLEFDLVVLIDPETFGDGVEGAVDRYVAMTRATQQLVVLTSSDVAGRTAVFGHAEP